MSISYDRRFMRIERTLERLRSSKSGGAIFYVSAFDSQSPDARYADFHCDGVNDEIQINEACAYAAKVVLLDGNFTIAAPILAVDNVTLAGSGIGTTKIHGSGSYAIALASTTDATISDLSILGVALSYGIFGQTTTRFAVDRVEIIDIVHAGVYVVYAKNGRVENCQISNCENGIVFGRAEQCRIVHNTLDNFTRSGVRVDL